ncbi:MAG: OmpA family protein [Pedobacter sp.]|nr:OmpA family protein [Pedobacter sp.]
MLNIHAAPLLPLSRLFRISGAQRSAVIAGTFALAMFAVPAQAADSDAYIAAGAYYMFADQDRGVDNTNLGIQFNPGFRLHESWWLEGHLFGANLANDGNGGTDFYHYGVGGDIVYAFGNRDELTPYVLAGAGYNYNDVVPDVDDGWDPFFNVGVGITHKFFGMDMIRWRLEARALRDGFMDDMMDYRVAAGLEFALGKSKPTQPQPEPTKIVEVRDREVIREVPVPVAAASMADQDLDHDGVINSRDKCPYTPEGAKVDGDGCVLAQTLTMRDVTFETNSSKLTLNGQRILDQVTDFLKSDNKVNLSIEGHTDARGSDAHNLKLSQARASSVRSYLVGKGIAADRLTAKGYGETRPVANNDTDAGREANRRVEMVISKAKK